MRTTKLPGLLLAIALALMSSTAQAGCGCFGRSGAGGPFKRLFHHRQAAATVIVMPEGPAGPALVHQYMPARPGVFARRPGQLQVQSVMEFRPQTSAQACTPAGCPDPSR